MVRVRAVRRMNFNGLNVGTGHFFMTGPLT